MTVAATARPICRTLCTGADKLSAVSYDPLAHARHNVGDRSAKVGHEIKDVPSH